MSNIIPKCKLRIGGFENDSIVDGPGIRFAIFLQGCKQRCVGCHNKRLQNFDGGKDFYIEEIFYMAKQNPLLDGITFSGGEPFCQAENLYWLAKLFKKENYDLAIYSGYLFEHLIREEKSLRLLELMDTLVDGPFVLEKRNLSLKFRGSENQRIIDVQKSLKHRKIIFNQYWY